MLENLLDCHIKNVGNLPERRVMHLQKMFELIGKKKPPTTFLIEFRKNLKFKKLVTEFVPVLTCMLGQDRNLRLCFWTREVV
jgi:hypothetical protein